MDLISSEQWIFLSFLNYLTCQVRDNSLHLFYIKESALFIKNVEANKGQNFKNILRTSNPTLKVRNAMFSNLLWDDKYMDSIN